MSPLCIYTIFDKSTGRPAYCGIRCDGHTIIEELYTNSSRRIVDIFNSCTKIGKIIAKAVHKRPVIITHFKEHLKWFDIPLSPYQYNVYDLHLPYAVATLEEMKVVLAQMEKQRTRPYQRLIANAAIVYEDMERQGLLINYTPHWPKWHMRTFSGRSSTTGCNIQGWHEPDNVRPMGASERNVIIHFDWIAADIRVASLLSGDERLQESFVSSDPYTVLMKAINAGSKSRLSRDDSKEYLLKSINSMDYTSIALASVYQDLGRWIRRCCQQLGSSQGYLESILGRRFRLQDAQKRKTKNPQLAVLNGMMQGSVVHAMHATLRRVWEVLPRSIIAEIHDCLMISSGPSSAEISAVIKTIVPIMMYPFAGILPDNPAFPVKVSISKRWKQAQALQIHREGGMVYVKKAKKKQSPQAATDQTPGPGTQSETVIEANA